MAQVVELAQQDKLKERVYICNADPKSMFSMGITPDVMGQFLMSTNLKEKPQIKKE